MLRFFTIIFLFLLNTNFVFAQDTLYKTNQEKLIVIVQKVAADKITYLNISSQDTAVNLISTSEVLKIVYSDGYVDSFVEENQKNENPEKIPFHRWSVGVNAFDLMYDVFTVSGEYFSEKHNFSIRVPLSSGLSYMAGNEPRLTFSPNYVYDSRDKIFSTGIDFRFYPGKQNHIVNFFLGFSFDYGMVRYNDYSYDLLSCGGPSAYYNTIQTKTVWFCGTGVTSGVFIKATENLNVGIDLSGGFQTTGNNWRDDAMVRAGITFGYRFGK